MPLKFTASAPPSIPLPAAAQVVPLVGVTPHPMFAVPPNVVVAVDPLYAEPFMVMLITGAETRVKEVPEVMVK